MGKFKVKNGPAFTDTQSFFNFTEPVKWDDAYALVSLGFMEVLGRPCRWETTRHLARLAGTHRDDSSFRHWLDRWAELAGYEVWNAIFDEARASGSSDKEAEKLANQRVQSFQTWLNPRESA